MQAMSKRYRITKAIRGEIRKEGRVLRYDFAEREVIVTAAIEPLVLERLIRANVLGRVSERRARKASEGESR